MRIAPIKPALPTTQPKRIYIITPKMVSIEGVKTPAKVPNFFPSVIIKCSFYMMLTKYNVNITILFLLYPYKNELFIILNRIR